MTAAALRPGVRIYGKLICYPREYEQRATGLVTRAQRGDVKAQLTIDLYLAVAASKKFQLADGDHPTYERRTTRCHH